MSLGYCAPPTLALRDSGLLCSACLKARRLVFSATSGAASLGFQLLPPYSWRALARCLWTGFRHTTRSTSQHFGTGMGQFFLFLWCLLLVNVHAWRLLFQFDKLRILFKPFYMPTIANLALETPK